MPILPVTSKPECCQNCILVSKITWYICRALRAISRRSSKPLNLSAGHRARRRRRSRRRWTDVKGEQQLLQTHSSNWLHHVTCHVCSIAAYPIFFAETISVMWRRFKLNANIVHFSWNILVEKLYIVCGEKKLRYACSCSPWGLPLYRKIVSFSRSSDGSN